MMFLILALTFVETTVVAAAGEPAFTWDPETILAGDRDAIIGNDKDARTVIFARPDTMVFEAKYDVAVTNEQGEVVEWQPDATSTLFTMSPDDISRLSPSAEPSYIWHYYPVASPSPEMTVGQYGTDGKAWHAFSMPGKYHVWMDVQYKWSAMPTNAPTSDPFRWATYHTEGDITVANGQPVLSDHLHQEVNRDTE